MKGHRVRSRGWMLLLVAALLTSGVAKADENIDLLNTLHRNHVITDQQYQHLKQQAEHKAAEDERVEEGRTEGKRVAQQQAQAQAVPTPTVHQYSGLPKVGGYAQLDFPLSVSDAGTIGSRTTLRRFYLQLSGKLAPEWSYDASFGYYNGATYFNKAKLSYSGLQWVILSGGYFKEPFSLSYLTSPKNLTLPEPALPSSALVPDKNIGFMASSHGQWWTIAGGVFGSSYDQTADAGVEGRWGPSLRGTLLPWQNRDGYWELGGSFAWREADSNHKANFGYRPETFVVASKLANASLTGVHWFATAGAETQLQWRSLRLQAEYLLTNVARASAPHLTFPGWYVETSWIITGERRKLSVSDSLPGGVVPLHPLSDGGWGAWELAGRYSVLDLNDADVSGGRERNASVGVNWYPQGTVKLMFDYIRVLPLQGGSFSGEDSSIVMARMQYAY